MGLSVIVPVHNGGKPLARCLEALSESTRRPEEILVVDDGSTDDSGALAERHGAVVVRVPGGPAGPAVGRNLGAQRSRGDVLVFIDADVAVHPDALARIAGYFDADPGLSALFGSYDDDPPAPGIVSRYKNLLHHHVHQNARPEASTFWAGCGAVRRAPFLACGGFDGDAYPVPSIEDIDLGVRLRRAGHRIRCCPDVLGTHWKRWTFASWLHCDIFRRASPWTRLILREGSMPDDLNLGFRFRLSAVAALAALALAAIGPWFPAAWVGSGTALATVAVCHAGLLRLLSARGGPMFALAGLGLHLLYLLYSSATFAAIAVPHRLGRRPLPSPVVCRPECAEPS
jgi:glycosyltransferase involved in cell wall biosynthesis